MTIPEERELKLCVLAQMVGGLAGCEGFGCGWDRARTSGSEWEKSEQADSSYVRADSAATPD